MINSTDMNRVSFETVKEMNDRHNKDGIGVTALSKEYGYERHTIVRWFKSYGLPYKQRAGKSTKYTDEFILSLYEEYKNGDSTVVIGKRHNIRASDVSRLFHRVSLPMRSNKVNSKKYSYNDRFFEEIDTEEKAYWLGFIYADGYVSENSGRYQIGIALSSIDIGHLEKFVKSIDGDNEIKTYKASEGNYSSETEYSRILISNDKMARDLIDKGVFLHKTNILKPPSIDSHLIRHFIRGYMDGDGSVSKSQNTYTVSFVGTDDLLTYIGEYFLDSDLTTKEVKLEKRKDSHTVSYIRYGGNIQAKRILNHLYEDSSIYLDRKIDKFHELTAM